ncbi:MAG: hypothetical protein QXU34_04495, partial [Ignisphaera sp.]
KSDGLATLNPHTAISLSVESPLVRLFRISYWFVPLNRLFNRLSYRPLSVEFLDFLLTVSSYLTILTLARGRCSLRELEALAEQSRWQ